MGWQYRCWRCWKRKALRKALESYEQRPKCGFCKTDSLFCPKDRLKKVRRLENCYCDAFHFPHRKGGGDCNPMKREKKELLWRGRGSE